jgi:hypothetical protein
MNKYLATCFLITIILLPACININPLSENYEPELGFPSEKLNNSFIITNPDINNNSGKNNDMLSLDLVNQSNEIITFPGDFNIKVYRKLGSKWVAVMNNLANPQGDWILPTKQDWKVGLGLDLIPYIPGLEKPTTIRVFAFGKTEKTGETVGAYIDLLLIP